ncbi:MAG: ABC transporter substrate-binding protein [Alphaproteobacteria bacterium]|nr:ABC transporter substrate-binding protein [Alphaproteobacteria bacterium]
MSNGIRVARRRIVAAAPLLATGALALPRMVFAQNKQAIKFTLPWVAEGSTLFTYVAKAMGFWDKHGLDVDIARGSGSIAAAQALAERRFDFGLSTPSIAILQAIKGLPIVSLACCAYDATMGVCVMNDGPVKQPKDLEGRTIASVVSSGDHPFFAPFVEKTGIDPSKINRLQVDNKVRDRMLPEGKVDAITGFASSVMPGYVASGVKAHFMLYSAYGLVNYGTSLMTQPQRVVEEPDLCAAFTDGLLQGLKFALLDPAEAQKLFFKQVPEMAVLAQGREQARVGNGILTYTVARDIVRQNGLGYMAPEDYETMADMVMRYLAGPGAKRPDVSSLLTNRFIGALKLNEPEFAEAQKNAEEFRAYVT